MYGGMLAASKWCVVGSRYGGIYARREGEQGQNTDLTFETVPVDPPAGVPMPRGDGHKFRRPRRSALPTEVS